MVVKKARSGRAFRSEETGASDSERLAAAASILLARIAEFETLVEPLAHEVEFGAIEIRQALRVDEHLHAMALEDDVFGRQLVRVFKLVGKAGTAGRLHAQPYADAFASLAEI